MQRTLSIAISLFLMLLSACGTSSQSEVGGQSGLPVDPTLFLRAGLVGDITEEPCTLSGGTETTCYRIMVASIPTDHDAGPWCPSTITDSVEEGGIWLESGTAYDVDGEFIRLFGHKPHRGYYLPPI